MRLINTTTFEVQEFTTDLPFYAILSHTWGLEEVTFEDIEKNVYKDKIRFEKLRGFCKLAASNGFNWAWIDTCCIDKRSSTELGEAINSMFAWYKRAMVCYAHLEDYKGDLGHCRWFRRGWTLQELIAPRMVVFYDKDWKDLGEKSELAAKLSMITGIDESILCSISELDEFSVAEKMCWASRRETTRVEDQAYCLLGLFDVHMPLIYGEGLGAFRRLQEEISKRFYDTSIFLWRLPKTAYSAGADDTTPIFARSPAAFVSSRGIIPLYLLKSTTGGKKIFPPTQFTLTNTGLEIRLKCSSPKIDGPRVQFANMECCDRLNPRIRYLLKLYVEFSDQELVSLTHTQLKAANDVDETPPPSIYHRTVNCRRTNGEYLIKSLDTEIGEYQMLLPLLIHPVWFSLRYFTPVIRDRYVSAGVDMQSQMSSYKVVLQNRCDLKWMELKEQGLDPSNDAVFFQFQNSLKESFALKVVVVWQAEQKSRTFKQILCYFSTGFVRNPISWKTDIRDGAPFPAKFRLDDGSHIAVKLRVSVTEEGNPHLHLFVNAHELIGEPEKMREMELVARPLRRLVI